jgi:hypothetical protein
MAKDKKPEWLSFGVGYVDVTLSRPSLFNGVEQTSVRMREPTVADTEAASEYKGSDAAREITALANLCDVSPDDVRKMPQRDFLRIQEGYRSFLD